MSLKHSVIGVMSGTSTDGLDIALCSFKSVDDIWSVEIERTKNIYYDLNFKKSLFNAHMLSSNDLKKFDNYYAEFISKEINKFILESNIKPDLIASHGHTIFHSPEHGITHQIGNGEIISKKTGIHVVYDFRAGDVALGGQGAPLVPIGDELLFGQYTSCLNLGGFSNISYKDNNGKRIAYDISPVNIVLNKLVHRLGFDYDDKGKIASSGIVNFKLLKALSELSYYSEKFPKSLSREWVESKFMPILDMHKDLNINDLLNTVTIHIAEQIAINLHYLKDVLITGGGTYNDFLIQNISKRTNTKIIIPKCELIDFKEAIVFAFLGLLRYLNKKNCLASVTGAVRDSCCGVLCVP